MNPSTTVGLIADTHCTRTDGSDLPEAATDALLGRDLIVPLGDLTSVGVLDRLAADGADVVIAYGVPRGGGGHDHGVALVDTTLIVTPGGPNLPVRHGTVARLTFAEHVDVEVVHLNDLIECPVPLC